MIKDPKLNLANKIKDNLKDTDPRTWMKHIKALGKANHNDENHSWKFTNEDKSDPVLTDEIADYFAGISYHFLPLNWEYLDIIPPGCPFVSEVPCLPLEYEVYQLLKRAKITCSVPHDLPVKFVRNFIFKTCNTLIYFKYCGRSISNPMED